MKRNILGKGKRRILVRNKKRDEMEKIKKLRASQRGSAIKKL